MGRHILPVAVGIVGATGLIGSTLVQQLSCQAPTLQAVLNAGIRIIGVTDSRKMLIQPPGVDDISWRDALAAEGEDLSLPSFGQRLVAAARQQSSNQHAAGPCVIVVDCTASEAPPDAYLGWMQAGLHIVTPNKKFGAGPLDRFRAVQQLSSETGRVFLAEASVGAGLPVLSTLRALVETGDKVKRIEGILSGTLSFIFNTYKPGMAFSAVVADAKARGYTEPDPREDLSGMDVARKVVILARDCGLDVTLDSLEVESLVPEPLAAQGVTAEDYMRRLPEFDADVARRADAADAAGSVIRYVGCVDVERKTARVNVASYPKDHPFSQLSGTDNMLVFSTERYAEQPLIVRGPGAGASVTAAGVLGDVIQAIRCHGNSA